MKHITQLSIWVSGLVLVMMSLAACAGKTTPRPDPTDNIAPTLSSSLPSQAANAVPINVKLGFVFSEAMAEGSLELSSNPALTLGNPTWSSDSTSVAFDNATLSPSTPYTLSLKANDIAGNALAATNITFTTSDTADTLAPGTPAGLIATPASGQVTLTWEESPETDVEGYTIYMGTSQDTLESRNFVTTTDATITNLTNNTTYFFAIDAVDHAANKSNKTTPVSATPSSTVNDTTPPTIQSSTPADNTADVTGEVFFRVVFSEPMDKNSLTVALNPPDYALENIIWSDNDTVLSLSPLQLHLFEQSENTSYTLSIAAKDKAGNALSGDKDINITTGFEVPTLVSSTPSNGATDVEASIVKASVITLTFSEAVKTDDTFQIVTDFPYACGSTEWETGSVTVTLFCVLNDSHTYNLSYQGQDLDGHSFAGSISFSTFSDTVPPSVFTTSPTDLKANVPLATPIIINFNDEMDEASTLAAVSSSPDVGCTWRLTPAKDTLECDALNLQGNTTYIVTVAATAQDTSGKSLVGSGFCRGTPPCSYEFMFSTVVTATTGSLRVNVSGLPSGQDKLRVTGPNGFNSGLFNESTTFSDLAPGDYTLSASGFVIAPGKPACRIYTPNATSQTISVQAGQNANASVTYSFESCDLPEF